MEKPASPIESLIESAGAYGKTTYELSKLKVLEVVSNVVASLLSKLMVVFAIVLFVFATFLSIGFALLIGDMLGKSWHGFFIVAAFYLAVGIILNYFLHKWLKKSVSDIIITQTFQ